MPSIRSIWVSNIHVLLWKKGSMILDPLNFHHWCVIWVISIFSAKELFQSACSSACILFSIKISPIPPHLFCGSSYRLKSSIHRGSCEVDFCVPYETLCMNMNQLRVIMGYCFLIFCWLCFYMWCTKQNTNHLNLYLPFETVGANSNCQLPARNCCKFSGYTKD